MIQNVWKKLKKTISVALIAGIIIVSESPFADRTMVSGSTTENQTSNENDTEGKSYLSIDPFIGRWQASGYALGTDRYTAYLNMSVREDGTFSIYDGEAGNPGLAGDMKVYNETMVFLDCNTEDFDSPWPGLKETDLVEYHFYNENQVRMTYNDISIVFTREQKGFEWSNQFKGNWSEDNCSTWYSNDGVKHSTTHKVSFDIDTILIYSVKGEKEKLVGSFCALDYNKKTGALKTITELKDPNKLPKSWRTMKEGRHFQRFTLKYNSKKHCVDITFDGKTYSFYSNIIYGVKTGSDLYYGLQDWECRLSNETLKAHLMDYGDGNLHLSLTRIINKRFYYEHADVVLNETKKSLNLKFDKEFCSKSFYKAYKSTKKLTYSFPSENKLVVKFAGKSYTFTRKN